jgi:hypothetical protein
VSIAATPAELSKPAVPSFRERFVGMLLRPRQTLAGITEPDAWFWPAILLLIGYTLYMIGQGINGAAFQASSMQRSLGNRSTSDPTLRFIMTAMPAILAFAMPLSAPFAAALSWGVRTAIFYGLARALGGIQASWARHFAVVGWAWVPLFFQYCILGAIMLLPEGFAYFAGISSDTSIGGVSQSMRQKWHGQVILYGSPFVIWNLVLCTLGVEEVFKLPRWKAGLVVLLPTAAQIFFYALAYWGSMSMMSAISSGVPPTNPTIPNGPAP